MKQASTFASISDKRSGEVPSYVVLLLFKMINGCLKKHSQWMNSEEVSYKCEYKNITTIV